MKKQFMKLKLAHRLLVIIFVFFLLPYVLLYFYSYWKAETIIKDKVKQVAYENIEQVGNNIETFFVNITRASDTLISLDLYERLHPILNGSSYQNLENYKVYDDMIQNVNNSLLDSQAIISVFSRDELLYSTVSSQSLDFQKFYENYIVGQQSSLERHSMFIRVHESYINNGLETSYISCIREVTSPKTEKNFYMVISIPTTVVQDYLNTTMGCMVMVHSDGRVIGKENIDSVDKELLDKIIRESMEAKEQGIDEVNLIEEISVVIYPDAAYGWSLLNIVSMESMYEDMYQLRYFILFFSVTLLVLCAVVTVYFIYHELKPLLVLKEHMEQITNGNLQADMETIESKDEISVLTQTFNTMVREINVLIEREKLNQRRENELRFEMLLAQINPHFLFNTLNSIKWMSIVAHTENITATITALGRLLEISMNKVNDILLIEEELVNIKSYIQIQQTRYPGRFEIQYEVEKSILQCTVLKLILQPIVENAILHNIECREMLDIRISGEEKDGVIYLRVRDNGIGVSQEQIVQMLKNSKEKRKGQVFRGIGVYNVHERLQLAYGEQYGLRFTSDGESYTEVEIVFPKREGKET